MIPKGKLVLIGGSIEMDIEKIDKRDGDTTERVILPQIIEMAGGPESRIELITCATSIPDKVWADYCNIFKKLGVNNLGNMFIQNRGAANDGEEILLKLEKADMILFTGGDQKQLIEHLRGTKFHELMLQRYLHEDFIIAGTSAGAMALSDLSLLGEKRGTIYEKKDLIMDKGFGFINQVIIDTHFMQRARLERLAEAIALYPEKLGIGVGEDTALVISEGNNCEVIGSGKVILIDGSHLKHQMSGGNGEDTDDESIPLFNLNVHILFLGDKYFIQDRKPESHHELRQNQPA